MRTLVAVIASVVLMLVSGCGCEGPVQRRQLLEPGTYKITIHSNVEQGSKAEFCYVTGTTDRLANCDAGAIYPKCSK